MGMLAAVKAYRALSPQQKQLLKAKKVSGDYSPDYWLRLLGGLSEFDTHADQLRKLGGTLAIGSSVAVVIGFGIPPLQPIGLLLFAIGGGIWLVTRHMDLNNRLRTVVLPLVSLVGDDVKQGRTLHMTLDLRKGTDKEKRTDELPPYKKGVYHKVIETHYEDPWLQWDAVLADGARLQLQLHDSIRHLKRTKRTARGKHKTKSKIKIKTRLDARLKLPVAHYRVRHLADNEQERLRVKVQSGDKWLDLHSRQIVLHAQQVKPGALPDAPALDPVLSLITYLYKGVESHPAEAARHV